MTNFQKTVWTILFSAVYMVAGVRLMQWLATVIYITPSGSIMHNLFMAIVPPINALANALIGGTIAMKRLCMMLPLGVMYMTVANHCINLTPATI